MANKELQLQEQQATEYANQLIKSHGVKPEGEETTFGVQGFWQEMVLTYLKDKALNFVGTTLKELAINHLVDLASWLLSQLEDYLLTKYQEATPDERELFKKKMLTIFPHSELSKKL